MFPISRSAKALPVVTVDEVLKVNVPWLFPVLGSFFCAAMKGGAEKKGLFAQRLGQTVAVGISGIGILPGEVPAIHREAAAICRSPSKR